MPDTVSERLIALGSAAAGIAHDINNQLTLAAIYLAVHDRDGALEALARCSALTASLLGRARGDTIQMTAVERAAFLQKYLARMRLPSGVRLVTEILDSLHRIAAHPLTLERTLTNLISNACAAMENSGTLLISASAQQIEVGDSGPGIPEAHAARIFEPFFSTKRHAGYRAGALDRAGYHAAARRVGYGAVPAGARSRIYASLSFFRSGRYRLECFTTQDCPRCLSVAAAIGQLQHHLTVF